MKKLTLLLIAALMLFTLVSSATIFAATPGPVTGLSATVYYTGRVNLSWSPATNAVKYFVEMYYQTGVGNPWNYYYSWNSTSTSMDVYPTIKGVNYRYHVRGVGSNFENGPFSNYYPFYMP